MAAVSARFVMVCGSGGVGKTTTSAAIGLAAAQRGENVLVVTVDPARRLAQALGLGEIGHGAADVPVEGTGSLAVSMLDTKAGWDALIRTHARDAATAERVLRNPLYDNITSRFVNSHDYIAMEQIHELAQSAYSLVVIDTPPSRNALDLLDAPRRMADFFSGRLLQWLTLPYRNRLLSVASKPFLQIADRLLGAQFLGDVAEFFTLLQSMEKGFVERSRRVESLLSSDRVRFVLVTTAEPESVEEALHLASELRARKFHLVRTVVNRVIPPVGADVSVPTVEETVGHAGTADAESAASVLAEISRAAERTVSASSRHAEGVERLRSIGTDVVVIGESSASDGRSVLADIGRGVGPA